MPGTHKFEFQCVIPFDLPSSVEGSIGHIRYTASVIVDIPMWQSKEFHEQFAVIKTIDLNDYPMLRVIYFVFSLGAFCRSSDFRETNPTSSCGFTCNSLQNRNTVFLHSLV